MKKSMALGLALAVAVPAGVWAQSATQNVSLTASVPKFCKYDSVSSFTGTINIGSTSYNTSSSTVEISAGANATGIMQDWAFTFNAQATCNFASTIQLTSLGGGLRPSPVPPISAGTFLDKLDYTANGRWSSSAAAALTTVGAAGSVSSSLRPVGAASSGNVTVDVGAVVNTTAPLLAGTYSDTLRITISPQ